MTTWTRRRWDFIWRYLRGRAPWDSGIVPPEITAWIELREARGDPPGRALDLGCGSGTTSLYLAARGWTVVGIDFALNAIWRARREARRRKLADRAAFHSADVSRLDWLPADPPFDLVVDVGCLHGLTPDQRESYAAHLARLTRPCAEFLLYAFMPRPGSRGGIDPDGVRALFGPAFDLADHTIGEEVTTPRPSGWYTLRRTDRRS